MLNARKRWGAGAALGVALLAAGCGDDRRIAGPAGRPNGDDVHAAAVVYDQVDFLGNPLVSEVTVPKALHEQYNETQPYNTATFRPITEQFIVQVGGRP